MATATLSASLRHDTGKGVARKLRQGGDIPGVIYGRDRAPQSLSLNARDFERLIARVSAASTVIELDLGGKSSRSLIREIQRHPFKRQILHVDFQEIVAGETVTLKCPIVYVGTPVGVRVEGGMLDQIMHELTNEVLPTAIPDHINVDVSNLHVGKSIHVSDLNLPAGVKALDDAGATVCLVQAPRTGATTESAEGAPAEPEVIRAKPKADEA
jgi:large subunit ribosomal protein L25